MSDDHTRCGGCDTVLEPCKEALVGPPGRLPPRIPYLCDRRDGGCGEFKFETTQAAAHNDRNRGIDPKHIIDNAGRSYSIGSDAFRNNYSKAFGHE